MTTRESLTVRELVVDADLGVVLLTAEAGLGRVIKGIHLSDLEDPTPWMTPGMVLLTTGPVFATSPDAGVRLLDRLARLDTAALGVGVGHHLEHVPDEMVARALEHGMAVFEAPLNVPFRVLTGYVYDALASTDMHRLRRSLAVQGHLLDLLVEEQGVANVVSALASILEAKVVLFDARGAVVAEAGATQRRKTASYLWERYKEGVDMGPLGVLEDGADRVYFRSVSVYGLSERVLAAVMPQQVYTEFVDTALSYAQKLVVLDCLREREGFALRRRMRALLLDDFLTGHGDIESFTPRMLELGVSLDGPWRVAVLDIDDFQRDVRRRQLTEAQIYEVKTRFIDAVDTFLGKHAVPFLTMVKGDSVVATLVVGARDERDVHELLVDLRASVEAALSPLRVSVGSSSPARDVADAGRCRQEAMQAVRIAAEGIGFTDHVALFDTAGSRFRLLHGQSPETLAALRDRLITPLLDYDGRRHAYLVQTLRVYLDSRLSITRAAGALYVHRNTLIKRLRRIEELLGVDLTSMDDVIELHLALRAGELLGDRAGA